MRSRPLRLAAAAAITIVSACRSAGGPRPTAPDTTATSADRRADGLILAAAKIALPPPGIAAGDLPEPTSRGASLLTTYCNQCHNLPAPTMHSGTDWPRVLRRMWLRMERLPDSFRINTADEGSRTLLLNYLTTNALRVSGTELPPGPGRTDFATVCSRCHALPDIRIHSSYDWPAVFMRMERNMERMNVSRPGPDETSRLLTYLQSASPKRLRG